MLTIQLTNTSFQINGKEFTFPILAAELFSHLGTPRKTKKEYNTIYTWDEDGLLAYTKDDKSVDSLVIQCELEKYDFSSQIAFNGALKFHEEEAIFYYQHNKEKLEKLFLSDDSGAFIFNTIGAWFSLKKVNDQDILSAIEIAPYTEPDFKNPKIKVALDSEYQNLEKVWLDWINAIETLVPRNNTYYNLISGITIEDIEAAERNIDFKIPKTLVNFYKVRDVDYNAVTSAFSFELSDYFYDLIPFKDIVKHWNDIQDLQSEGQTDYADPKWIPFAESRQGDYLVFDSSNGQIIELQNESWKRDIVAESLDSLIYSQIVSIKNGSTKRYDFILGKR